MPVSLAWDNPEKTILRYDLAGHWTWDEMLTAFDEGTAWLKSLDYTVDFIVHPVDPIAQAYVPPNSLGHVIRLHGRALPNAGITVMVNTSNTARMLMRLMTALNPKIAARYLLVDSLEIAREKLALKHTERTSL